MGWRGQTGRFGTILRDSIGLSGQGDKPSGAIIPDGLAYSWDMASDELSWGPNAAEILGLDPSRIPRSGEAYRRMIEPGSGPDRLSGILSADRSAKPSGAYDIRYVLRLETGRIGMVEDSGRFWTDAERSPALARGIIRVRSEAGAMETTSAPARIRSEFLAKIQDQVAETRGFSLIAGLLDGSGDTDGLMAEVESAIRPLLRRGDLFLAYAPNRFALALASCGSQDVESAMRRLVSLVEASSFVLSEHLRLGAACAPDHARDALTLLTRAEEALDTAVERALRLNPYRPQIRERRTAGTCAFDLIDALNDRRIAGGRQPIMDALSDRPALFEIQPRLMDANGVMLPAQDLSTAMEGAGLSILLDARMLELAADHLASHPQDRLVVPVTQATVQDPEWLKMLAAHLGARPGIATRLMIGLPALALRDIPRAWGRLDAMKALGVSLAVQGFGSGHVGCAQLRDLPMDLLKIDGPLIQTLGRSTQGRLFVRTLIDTARRFGMATLAEWVEDAPTARMLGTWGVDYLQGGLYEEWSPLTSTTPLLQAKRA